MASNSGLRQSLLMEKQTTNKKFFRKKSDANEKIPIDTPLPVLTDESLTWYLKQKILSDKSKYVLQSKDHAVSKESSTYTNSIQHEHLQNNENIVKKTKTYLKRWYILFVYCLLTFTQATMWNTWGPVAETTEEVFGWTDADVALLTNLGPIAFLLVVFLISWIVDTKGLRWACVLTAFFIFLGAAIRCITSDPLYLMVTAGIGQFLNGIGTPVAMGVPPVLSSTWFPPHQRTLATAIASVCNTAGIAASFIIGPALIPALKKTEDESNTLNYSNVINVTTQSSFTGTTRSNVSYLTTEDAGDNFKEQREGTMLLMYVECGWCAFVLLVVAAYFPAKPELPPSLSAGTQRVNFIDGIKSLLRNKIFWMIACSYGISLGILGGWPGLLDIVLKPHGISETDAGMIGFYAIICGIVLALLVSKLADLFSKHKKWILLGLYCVSVIFLLWMNLILSDLVTGSPATLSAGIVIGAAMLTATTPIYFELACENTYPVAEGITNFVLTLINNIASVVFLAVQMIPGVGTSWEGWCLFGAVVICIPGLYLMKEKTNRLNVDEQSSHTEKC